MAFTLSEKHAWNSLAERQPCDLESPPATASRRDEPSDVPVGSLLTATTALLAVTIVLWFSTKAIKWSLHWLLLKLSGRCGRSSRSSQDQDTQDDASGTIIGSPLTPPPNGWLHDIDLAHPAYITPPPGPLLFSLSPTRALGNGAGPEQPLFAAHLPTMHSMAGHLGSYPAGPSFMRGLHDSPDGGAMQHCSGGRVANGRRGGGEGAWDRGLLSRQAALLPAISSVEGLMATAEFQEHVRSKRRRSPILVREQSQAKVQLYKDLRRLDPDAFRKLLSRDDIQTYEERPPPLAFAVVDYLVGVVGVPLVLVALYRTGVAMGSPLIQYGPPIIWLAVRLRIAVAGHASLLGRVFGVYLVYDTPDEAPNAWEGMSGVGGHFLLALFELLMAGLSCGLLVLGTLVSIAVGSRRQTLAMRLLGLRLEQELCRPNRLSPFSPTSDTTTTMLPKASSPRSFGSLPGRYGLSNRM